MGKCKKFYFLFLSLTYTKEERCFYRVLENNFLFLRKKIAIRLHFLKSYSFAIDNIELLLVLIIRIILSTYKFFPSSYATVAFILVSSAAALRAIPPQPQIPMIPILS